MAMAKYIGTSNYTQWTKTRKIVQKIMSVTCMSADMITSKAFFEFFSTLRRARPLRTGDSSSLEKISKKSSRQKNVRFPA